MLVLFLFILSGLTITDSSHFNGGTITWFPVNPASNSSPVLITITQSYSWVYPDVKCLNNVPASTGNSFYYTINLTCVSNCTTDGGYSAKPISIATDCTSASTSVGLMTSQRSVNISLNAGARFTLAYESLAWRKVGNSNASNPGWSIACLIDLRRRPDGVINTPPVSSVASPQYVIPNRTVQIKLPISDVNEDDDLRCRWGSSKSSSTNADECADVCYPAGLPPGTNLTGCTLTFTGLAAGTWYVISLQVEDFINTTSTVAMSSVPVQFLVYVMANLSCTQPPVFLPLTNCTEVQVGTPVILNLYVMNLCNRTKTIISDIIDTVSITGMQISNISNSTTNVSLSYVTLNWTPTTSQIGSRQFCAIAYTNGRVQSDEYCITFNVKSLSNFCIPTTTTTTSTTSTTTTSQTTTTTTRTTTSTSTTSTSRTTSTTSQTTTTTTTSQTTTTTKTTTSTSTTSTSQTTSTTSQTTTSTTTTQTTTSTTSVTTTTTTTTQTTTSTSTTTSSATTTTTTQTTTSTTTSVTTTTSTTTSTSTSTTSTTSTTTTTTTTQTTTSTTTSETSTTSTTTSTSTSTTTTSSTATTSTTTETTTSSTTTQTTTSSSTTSTSTTSTTTTSTTTTSSTTTQTTTSSTTTSTSTSSTTTTSTTTTTTTTQTTTSTTTSVTTTTSTTSQTTTSTTTTTSITTTTTTSITTTSSTSTTTTVTTTTSVTSTTTTSLTTTTETSTTTTSAPNSTNIPLIVGLSLLGLLVAICCLSYWLHSFFRKSSKGQGFRRKKYSVSDPSLSNKFSEKSKKNNRDQLDVSISNGLTENSSLSINNTSTTTKDIRPITTEKPTRSKHSAITIQPLNKVSDSLESKISQPTTPKSAKNIELKPTSAASNKFTVVKLSRRELSNSTQNRSNDDSEPNDNRIDDEIDLLNEATKSTKDISLQLNEQSVTNMDNKNNTIRRRNSSFGSVAVTKIKKGFDDNNIPTNQSKTDLNSSVTRSKNFTPKVTRISTKQKRSAVRPQDSNN